MSVDKNSLMDLNNLDLVQILSKGSFHSPESHNGPKLLSHHPYQFRDCLKNSVFFTFDIMLYLDLDISYSL